MVEEVLKILPMMVAMIIAFSALLIVITMSPISWSNLTGKVLIGQYILEIPATNANIPNIEYFKSIAKEYDVILRFTEE